MYIHTLVQCTAQTNIHNFVHYTDVCITSNLQFQEFEALRRNVLTALGQLQEEIQRTDTRVQCCVTGTLVLLRSLPAKLNPVIRPLMDCIKKESDPLLQVITHTLTQLLHHLVVRLCPLHLVCLCTTTYIVLCTSWNILYVLLEPGAIKVQYIYQRHTFMHVPKLCTLTWTLNMNML